MRVARFSKKLWKMQKNKKIKKTEDFLFPF